MFRKRSRALEHSCSAVSKSIAGSLEGGGGGTKKIFWNTPARHWKDSKTPAKPFAATATVKEAKESNSPKSTKRSVFILGKILRTNETKRNLCQSNLMACRKKASACDPKPTSSAWLKLTWILLRTSGSLIFTDNDVGSKTRNKMKQIDLPILHHTT